jgi:predicted DNA-binding transcriptional regulator YafY
MYSPTTRVLTVLELLQSHRQMKGSEIARRLEVDGRTVRRYITMLQDMGIPVEGERGPYGAYELQRGYKLPPLMFTDAEAVALTLGLLAIREFRFPVDVAAVEGALAKTERVMPENLLQQVRGLQEAITFNVPAPPVALQTDLVVTLSLAVQQRQRVHLHYRSWIGEESERDFDPYGIVFNEGYWHTIGYCHLRHDVRTFRLDRIIRLEAGEESFERPEDFDVVGRVLHSIAFIAGAKEVEVVLETTMERARQVIPPIMGTLEPSEQGVIFRRTASQLEWIAHVLISLDFPVHVVQPVELRDMLRQIAVKALRMAGEDVSTLEEIADD